MRLSVVAGEALSFPLAAGAEAGVLANGAGEGNSGFELSVGREGEVAAQG